MFSLSRSLTCILLAIVAISANGFIAGKTSSVTRVPSSAASINVPPSTTALSERKWNFNEGRGPWGMKKNAEIWNGRVAQVAFVWIFAQELITGKGIFQGIEEGDFFFIANAGLVAVIVVGLTGFLAMKGVDDYTEE